MARRLRLGHPGAVYQVAAHGKEHRAAFRDDEDREQYLARSRHYQRYLNAGVYAYCLMSSRVHHQPSRDRW